MDRRLFRFLLRSHRLVGIYLVVFIILLSVTGILLNHTDSLGLSKQNVPALVAKRYYSSEVVDGYQLGQQYAYTLGGELKVGQQILAQCGLLAGAVEHNKQFVFLCDGELLIFTTELELVERMSAAYGLPEQLSNIANVNDALILNTPTDQFEYDVIELKLEAFDGKVEFQPRIPVPSKHLAAETISWQQFLLDLHSGMFVGVWGKWFMDLVAICLMGMAVSGFVMWRRFH